MLWLNVPTRRSLRQLSRGWCIPHVVADRTLSQAIARGSVTRTHRSCKELFTLFLSSASNIYLFFTPQLRADAHTR